MSVPITTRHIEATRKAILDAAAELLLERRNGGFSVQEVAHRAGLTHRTVYRYFPTRQELMAETARSIAPGLAAEDFGDVSTVEGWIEALPAHLARTEANFEVMRSILVAVLASDNPAPFGQAGRDRDMHRWQVFRREFPHIPDPDARRTFATLRHLTSSISYVLYRIRFGMSPTEALEAIQAEAQQLVHQAEQRDRAARDGRTK